MEGKRVWGGTEVLEPVQRKGQIDQRGKLNKETNRRITNSQKNSQKSTQKNTQEIFGRVLDRHRLMNTAILDT
jgi:hypothetical protein